MNRRSSLFETISGPRYRGGVLAGLGLGFWIGYAIHQDGLLTVKAAYLSLPCVVLLVIGQTMARARGKVPEVVADEQELV